MICEVPGGIAIPIGTTVTLTAGGRTMSRDIAAGDSYLSTHDPRPHFGLGRAEAVDEDAVERVELSFSHHRVVAVGENLRQILEWCRNSQVLCLRSMPAAHRANLRPTAPFISQLEVQALADLKNPPAGELPF